MTAIFQTIFTNAISWKKGVLFNFKFTKFFPRCCLVCKSASVPIIDWCPAGDKPLHEPMLPKLRDAVRGHHATAIKHRTSNVSFVLKRVRHNCYMSEAINSFYPEMCGFDFKMCDFQMHCRDDFKVNTKGFHWWWFRRWLDAVRQ